MNSIERIIQALEGTSYAEQLKEIYDFMGDTSAALDSFTRKGCVECEKGCGRCCECFMPDITKSEAMLIASEIMSRPDKEELVSMLQESKDHRTGPCPLYNKDSEFHCRIYSSRPLICRLFASSCFPDKKGEAMFSNCHLSKKFKGMDKDEVKRISDNPPMMGHFGHHLRSLEGNSQDTMFLPEAVLKWITKFEYILFLIENNAS